MSRCAAMLFALFVCLVAGSAVEARREPVGVVQPQGVLACVENRVFDAELTIKQTWLGRSASQQHPTKKWSETVLRGTVTIDARPGDGVGCAYGMKIDVGDTCTMRTGCVDDGNGECTVGDDTAETRENTGPCDAVMPHWTRAAELTHATPVHFTQSGDGLVSEVQYDISQIDQSEKDALAQVFDTIVDQISYHGSVAVDEEQEVASKSVKGPEVRSKNGGDQQRGGDDENKVEYTFKETAKQKTTGRHVEFVKTRKFDPVAPKKNAFHVYKDHKVVNIKPSDDHAALAEYSMSREVTKSTNWDDPLAQGEEPNMRFMIDARLTLGPMDEFLANTAEFFEQDISPARPPRTDNIGGEAGNVEEHDLQHQEFSPMLASQGSRDSSNPVFAELRSRRALAKSKTQTKNNFELNLNSVNIGNRDAGASISVGLQLTPPSPSGRVGGIKFKLSCQLLGDGYDVFEILFGARFNKPNPVSMVMTTTRPNLSSIADALAHAMGWNGGTRRSGPPPPGCGTRGWINRPFSQYALDISSTVRSRCIGGFTFGVSVSGAIFRVRVLFEIAPTVRGGGDMCTPTSEPSTDYFSIGIGLGLVLKAKLEGLVGAGVVSPFTWVPPGSCDVDFFTGVGGGLEGELTLVDVGIQGSAHFATGTSRGPCFGFTPSLSGLSPGQINLLARAWALEYRRGILSFNSPVQVQQSTWDRLGWARQRNSCVVP